MRKFCFMIAVCFTWNVLAQESAPPAKAAEEKPVGAASAKADNRPPAVTPEQKALLWEARANILQIEQGFDRLRAQFKDWSDRQQIVLRQLDLEARRAAGWELDPKLEWAKIAQPAAANGPPAKPKDAPR